MIEKDIEFIDREDIASIIENEIPEGRRIEFKRTLPRKNDDGVKEFLADISSFANSDGGDIIFGIDEGRGGIAAEITGIESAFVDREILRLESIARTSLDPRIPHLRFHAIPLGDGGQALIVRVGPSLLAPHRVIHKGTSRFWARNSRGKFEMDTGELRLAFAATDRMAGKIRDLHASAIAKLEGIDMPCALGVGPIAVLTLAPLSILRERRDVSVTRANAIFPPGPHGGYGAAVGLEGVVTFAQSDDGPQATSAWAFNYRSGYIDQAWTIGSDRGEKPRVWLTSFRDNLRSATRSALARLQSHQIGGPWVAMLTIVNVKGFHLPFGDGHYSDAAWVDSAFLGEIVDESMGEEALEPFWMSLLRVFGTERGPSWAE